MSTSQSQNVDKSESQNVDESKSLEGLMFLEVEKFESRIVSESIIHRVHSPSGEPEGASISFD